MTISNDELRKLAATYSCSEKTICRLLHRGVDVTDPEVLAAALAGQKNLSLTMAAAVLTHLPDPSND